jgi:hypothetical protein
MDLIRCSAPNRLQLASSAVAVSIGRGSLKLPEWQAEQLMIVLKKILQAERTRLNFAAPRLFAQNKTGGSPMKSLVSGALATLMLLGLLAAAAMPKPSNSNPQVLVASGLPMPTCDPPGCR